MPVEPSYVKFAKGTPSARFLKILQSWEQVKLLQKEGQKKHPGANAIMSCLKFPLSANPAQHFAVNRASKSARGAELCQICQGDPQRAFSEILQSWEQVKLLQKEGQKKHPGANAIMS